VSREEAVNVIKEWIEHRMLWFNDNSFTNKYLVHQAINILGTEEVDKIHKELKNNWEDE
jgi:hypothetical protein